MTSAQNDDLIFGASKPLQVPQLADKIVAIMEDEGMSLADLLQGLPEEREIIWQERGCNSQYHATRNTE